MEILQVDYVLLHDPCTPGTWAQAWLQSSHWPSQLSAIPSRITKRKSEPRNKVFTCLRLYILHVVFPTSPTICLCNSPILRLLVFLFGSDILFRWTISYYSPGYCLPSEEKTLMVGETSCMSSISKCELCFHFAPVSSSVKWSRVGSPMSKPFKS